MKITNLRLIQFIIPILSGVGLFISTGNASVIADPGRMAVAFRASEYVANEEYEPALELADSLIQAFPNQPDGWILRATVLNSRSIDFEDKKDQSELVIACDTVIAQCERIIAREGASAPINFYLGSAYSFKGIIEGRTGSWLSVISTFMKAGSLFEEAIKLDPTFADAFYGVGLFYYFQSSKAGLFRMVGLVSDRRELGKQYIQIALQNGYFSRIPAQSSLAWIAIDEKQYDSAISIANDLLKRYPNKRSYLWALGSAQIKAEYWEDAIQTYTTLLASTRSHPRNNRYNEVGCLHSLAKANAALERWEAVLQLSGEALAIPLEKDISDRKKKDISRLKKLRATAQDKLKRQK